MTRTVSCKFVVRECPVSDGRQHHPVNIIVVPRHPLALLSKDATRFEPLARPMQNDDLIPERPLGNNRCDACNREWDRGHFIRNVWCDRQGFIGVECRLRAGFDLDCRSYVWILPRRYARIPEEQTLPVGVIFIDDQAGEAGINIWPAR